MPEEASFSYAKIEIGPLRADPDGTSDTFMFAEMRMPEKEHVLTAVQHTADGKVYADPVTFTATVSAPSSSMDDGLLLPAVQDHGLLLPAVQDYGLLLPA
jgi:hypothetical protein